MATPTLSCSAFRDRLQTLLEQNPGGAVVFDADGTLWRHDVGCMVYDLACEHGLFRPEALSALSAELERLGQRLPPQATANDAALQLQAAWRAGDYDERAAAEMQVWAYVGFSEFQFRELTREALKSGGHQTTLHKEVLALAEWVRSAGGKALIVSASPKWVVEEATRDHGFKPDEIAAGMPQLSGPKDARVIQAGMDGPLPYGPDKVVAGRALLAGLPWLAALGDSSFDLDMMAEARLAGGIGTKPEMLDGLARLAHGVRLSLAATP